MPSSAGPRPRFITLHEPDWHFDEKELARTFNNKTKAIVINTPNNPTGKVFSREELQFIADLCLKWGVVAVTDEIYEHILYDGAKHISIASLPGMRDQTITINSISKTYSLTGWRVGWAIASAHLTASIRKVHDFLTVGAAHPSAGGRQLPPCGRPSSYYQDPGGGIPGAEGFSPASVWRKSGSGSTIPRGPITS